MPGRSSFPSAASGFPVRPLGCEGRPILSCGCDVAGGVCAEKRARSSLTSAVSEVISSCKGAMSEKQMLKSETQWMWEREPGDGTRRCLFCEPKLPLLRPIGPHTRKTSSHPGSPQARAHAGPTTMEPIMSLWTWGSLSGFPSTIFLPFCRGIFYLASSEAWDGRFSGRQHTKGLDKEFLRFNRLLKCRIKKLRHYEKMTEGRYLFSGGFVFGN